MYYIIIKDTQISLISIRTSFETSENATEDADYLQLHWSEDTLRQEKMLVMMDVEPEGNFYGQKGYICQYVEGSPCYEQSEEGLLITYYY